MHDGKAAARLPADSPASLDQVLALAMRPFLARCSEALATRSDVAAAMLSSTAARAHCPFCGWEPDFAVITASAETRLICGRCAAQWGFPSLTCPFCANDDRGRITSFAGSDRLEAVNGFGDGK